MDSVRNQRGQGTVEYILILTLAVAIILGAIVQLNSAFRVWADNYFGEYLSCLLETGELPSLSGGAPDSLCDEAFRPFSLAEGRPAVGDPIGSGGSGSDEDGGEDSDGQGRARPATTSSSDSGSQNDQAYSRRGNSGGRRIRVSSSQGAGSQSGEGATDESGQVTFNSFNQGGRVVRIPIRETAAIRQRRYREDQKEKERARVKTTAEGSSQERDGAPQLIKSTVRKTASDVPDTGFEWSFGNLLRWLIIIAILIAILLFIGGQALQISKSLEK